MTSMPGDGPDSAGHSQKGISLDQAKYGDCEACPFGARQTSSERGERRFDYVAMKESAERGHCQACAGIVKFLQYQGVEPTCLVYRDYKDSGLSFQLKLDDGILHSQACEFFVKNKEPAGEESTTPGVSLDFGKIPPLRAPSGHTSSEAAFETLKHWITRCQAYHPRCQLATENRLPRRVLEIKSSKPLRIRLVENCMQYEEYACLSHRWAEQTKQNSLKKGNLDLYKIEVPEDKLYPLIRDALEVTSRLGLRFIWIDCYCIVQDDIKDWETEAANMASIYENAFITVSATFPEDGSSMFYTMPRNFEAFPITEIRGETVYLRPELPHPRETNVLRQEYSTSPLLKRAWVFQERLLSHRFIHFTPTEIFWDCRESTWCECESRSNEWLQCRKQEPWTIGGQDWKSITEQYNSTRLTFEKDRLPALAGLARRYGELRGGWTYLGGLWKEQLLSGLAWYKHMLSEQDRPLEQFAPTWSWASLPRGLRLATPLYTPRTESMSLVGYKIIPSDADVYTSKGIEITVEGPLLELDVYTESSGCLIGRRDDGFLRMTSDFNIDPDDDVTYRTVPNGSRCRLLLMMNDDPNLDFFEVFGILLLQATSSVDGGDEKFERIGHIDWTGFDESFVDLSSEYAGYRGGSTSLPALEDMEHAPDKMTIGWLQERAEKKHVTLI